ncbi:MAG TPA: PTS sugar transporter subunit IIA [Anaerolineae bacterium]|nr:PTS sugar transporter subunit IIA [Anaerolineae bacterium]
MDTSSIHHIEPRTYNSFSPPLSFRDLLPCERIKLDVQVHSWREAIREAGKLLLLSEAITPDYIDAMIRTAEDLGPYIVIAKGIAMPHASLILVL